MAQWENGPRNNSFINRTLDTMTSRFLYVIFGAPYTSGTGSYRRQAEIRQNFSESRFFLKLCEYSIFLFILLRRSIITAIMMNSKCFFGEIQCK